MSTDYKKHNPAYPIGPGSPGITRLELFAGMALQGLLAKHGDNLGVDDAVKLAFKYANEIHRRSTKEQKEGTA